MISKDFLYKFTIPELSQIAGKKYSNIILLSVFLILVLTAIGISKGAIYYLEKKMAKGYVTLTSVEIPAGFDKEKLKELSKIKNKYGIVRTFPVYEDIRSFVNPENPRSFKNAQIRKGMNDDPIINDFNLKKKNTFNFKGWGCVVTRSFLKELGYCTCTTKICGKDHNVPYIYKPVGNDFINIPVEGIIDDLPDNLDMIVGDELFKSFDDLDFWHNTIKDRYINKLLRLYVNKNNLDIKSKLLKYGFKKKNHNIFSGGELWDLFPIDSINKNKVLDDFSSYKKNIYEAFSFERRNNIRDWQENITEEKYVFEFHKDSLKLINVFNQTLMSEYRDRKEFLKIDLSIINSKTNFDIVKELVELLALAIYLLSVIFISIYIVSMIGNHIDSNKKNLGTLKAFGLSNFTIVAIYSFISITMIVISLLIAYVVSVLFGQDLMNLLTYDLDNLSEMEFLPQQFKILFLIFIILPAFWIIIKINNKLKNKTPGDLIYERNNN